MNETRVPLGWLRSFDINDQKNIKIRALVQNPPYEVDELLKYDYPLKAEQIAQRPLESRSAARLLDARYNDIVDRNVVDLPDLCDLGDVVVLNDTKVFPARVSLFKATGGKVELLLVEATHDGYWIALANPSKGLQTASELFDHLGNPLVYINQRFAKVGDSPVRLEIKLLAPDLIERLGEIPLPPYIKTPLDSSDRYQTVFANRGSSVAAPTAGLHLDDEVITRLKKKGISVVTVELSVGLDTFLPVRAKVIKEHKIHTESYVVTPEAWQVITSAKRVVAVGTTVVRTLETVANTGELAGRSSLFIHGDYRFKVVDRLMTNFHIPRSSLLLLVDSFVGSRWRQIYDHGLNNGYRFLSFGDAMLLDRRNQP